MNDIKLEQVNNEDLEFLNNKINSDVVPEIDKMINEKGYASANEVAEIINSAAGFRLIPLTYEGSKMGYTKNPFIVERS